MAVALNVWMNGEWVGVWIRDARGTPVFRYEAAGWNLPMRGPCRFRSRSPRGDHEIRGDAVTQLFRQPAARQHAIPGGAWPRAFAPSPRRLRSAHGHRTRLCGRGAALAAGHDAGRRGTSMRSEPLSDDEVERILADVTSDVPLGLRDDRWRRRFAHRAPPAHRRRRRCSRWTTPGPTARRRADHYIFKLPLALDGNRPGRHERVGRERMAGAHRARTRALDVAATEMATFGQQKSSWFSAFDRRWMSVPPGGDVQHGFIPPADAVDRAPAAGTLVPGYGHAGATASTKQTAAPPCATAGDLLASGERAARDRTHFVLAQLVVLGCWPQPTAMPRASRFFTGSACVSHDAAVRHPLRLTQRGGAREPGVLARGQAPTALRSTPGHHWRLRDIQPRHWQRLARNPAACSRSDVELV